MRHPWQLLLNEGCTAQQNFSTGESADDPRADAIAEEALIQKVLTAKQCTGIEGDMYADYKKILE